MCSLDFKDLTAFKDFSKEYSSRLVAEFVDRVSGKGVIIIIIIIMLTNCYDRECGVSVCVEVFHY